MIRKGSEEKSSGVREIDAVIVGLGAGGGMMLRELARAGLRVVALEEGGDQRSETFTQREDEMIPRLFQEAGGRCTADRAITVLSGKGIGGSTIHNTNLCKRIPKEILAEWDEDFGLTLSKDLPAVFERVERELSVSVISEELQNANNRALRKGVERLGLRGGPLSHNRRGCRMSGFCELGCAYDAKENARKVLIPAALEAGAEIYSETRARKLILDGERVRGVVAETKAGATITFRAKSTILAGSAIGSAALARASKIPDPHRQIGRHLRIHPGAVVAGRFDEALASFLGIPQSYECTEFLSFERASKNRTWIVPAFAHPIGTASMLPGFGAGHMRLMRSYDKLAVLTSMVHDETEGEVDVDDDGEPILRYVMNDTDVAALRRGLLEGAKILFAAGAKEVVFPTSPPIRLTREAELAGIDASRLRPHGMPITAVHPMGTLRMGRDRRKSVVDDHGEFHSVKGLFAADGSLYPTSIGGPPQIGIYTLALHLAPRVLARTRAS